MGDEYYDDIEAGEGPPEKSNWPKILAICCLVSVLLIGCCCFGTIYMGSAQGGLLIRTTGAEFTRLVENQDRRAEVEEKVEEVAKISEAGKFGGWTDTLMGNTLFADRMSKAIQDQRVTDAEVDSVIEFADVIIEQDGDVNWEQYAPR